MTPVIKTLTIGTNRMKKCAYNFSFVHLAIFFNENSSIINTQRLVRRNAVKEKRRFHF